MRKKIAIIGAGIAGLTVAKALSDRFEVTIFEKSRGVGGRMSARYAEPFYFDHGAPYFTAHTPEFQDFLSPFIQNGTVAEMTGKMITLSPDLRPVEKPKSARYLVAVPNMNGLCKRLAEGVKTVTGVEVAPLTEKTGALHKLRDQNGAEIGAFDHVISTAPSVQTLRLFAAFLPADHPLNRTVANPCHTLMIGLNRPYVNGIVVTEPEDHVIEKIVFNSEKNKRNRAVTCLVAYTSADMSKARLEDDLETVKAFLRKEAEILTGFDCSNPAYIALHRWRYATVAQTEVRECYHDAENAISVAGDSFVSIAGIKGVESAWLSAKALIQKF